MSDESQVENGAAGPASSGPAAGNSKSRDGGKKGGRPGSLLRQHGLRFVNRMRNIGWLAGWSSPCDEHSFYLHQTNNVEQALRIEVPERYKFLTTASRNPTHRPVLAMVHCRGYRDKDGPQIALQCIELDRPSMLDMPIESVWASGFGKGRDAAKILGRIAKADFSPFDKEGNIREEYKEFIDVHPSDEGKGEHAKQFALTERTQRFLEAHSMLGEILDVSGGIIDSRLDRGQNYVSIAGFVDAKAWKESDGYRSSYGLIMLRQQENQDENIPIHIVGRMAKPYFEHCAEGAPILIEGSARRKVIPSDDDPAVPKARLSYIEAERIELPVMSKDIMLPPPEWWSTIRDRLIARRAARVAARKQQEDTKPATAEIGDIEEAE